MSREALELNKGQEVQMQCGEMVVVRAPTFSLCGKRDGVINDGQG